MKTIFMTVVMTLASVVLFAEGYAVGDKADGFILKNVDGKMVSLNDYPDAKGFVVIFTCNHCPYAKAWEGRIIDLDKKYKTKGYPVIAISSNDASIVPDDDYDHMVAYAKEKGFTFPYLYDETQEVADKYGAMRTPHVYLLEKEKAGLIVKYIGAIDNNYKNPSEVTETYLADAIDAVLTGKDPNPSETKAVGCSIKRK